MRQDYPEFVARGAEVVAVGPDGREAFREYWAKEDLPFVGLADPDHAIARLYRQEVSLLKLGRLPALLVIDRAGQVRYQHYSDSMSDIPTNAEVLAELDRLGEA